MLMNRIRDTYREITGYIEPATPVSIVPGQRFAANAENVTTSDMHARRQRRQRRNQQPGLGRSYGWTVRTW